jgi:hypothetical protein
MNTGCAKSSQDRLALSPHCLLAGLLQLIQPSVPMQDLGQGTTRSGDSEMFFDNKIVLQADDDTDPGWLVSEPSILHLAT